MALNKIRRAILSLVSRGDAIPNDNVVTTAPSPQRTVDLFDHWISIFPADAEIKTDGYASLFDDDRASWGINTLGGVRGLNILELGPLEGAHSYMLDRAGAGSVLAIEAMKRSYLKCLITKELLRIDGAHFLLGDFIAWMEANPARFDLIWASGVLYHMVEPLKLLRLIAEHTDQLFLWTHFYPDDYEPTRPYRAPLVGIREVEFGGRIVPHFDRSYGGSQTTKAHCGGMLSHTAWLRRGDILFALRALGYSRIEVGPEDHASPLGPSFTLVGWRG